MDSLTATESNGSICMKKLNGTSKDFRVSSTTGTDMTAILAVQLLYDTMYNMSGVGLCMVSDRNLPQIQRYTSTMKRTVAEISDRHSILFKSMVKKLSIDENSAFEVLKLVLDEMFADGQYNWGRVVSVYAFVGWLARYCVESDMAEYVATIAKTAANEVALRLAPWISDNGGWDAFVKFFDERVTETPERKVLRGLLYTVCIGLGAVVTTMVIIR